MKMFCSYSQHVHKNIPFFLARFHNRFYPCAHCPGRNCRNRAVIFLIGNPEMKTKSPKQTHNIQNSPPNGCPGRNKNHNHHNTRNRPEMEPKFLGMRNCFSHFQYHFTINHQNGPFTGQAACATAVITHENSSK